MNTKRITTSVDNHYLSNSEDRKTLTMLLTAVYSPLVLMLIAALFLA